MNRNTDECMEGEPAFPLSIALEGLVFTDTSTLLCFEKPFSIKFPARQDWEEDIIFYKKDPIIFVTDGSKTDEGFRAEVFCRQLRSYKVCNHLCCVRASR